MSVKIYVPGKGLVDASMNRVDTAVNEYDERLFFAQNGETGQYCIFLKMPHGEDPLPVLGFDTIPHPEDALKRLYYADTMRHGEKILDDINKNNAAIKKPFEDAAEDAGGQVAEGLEWAHRKLGTHPTTRIHVSRAI